MDKRYCIFDMDGTLVDSMGYWRALGQDFLRSRGVTFSPSELTPLKQMTVYQGAVFFMETFGVSGPPEDIIAAMAAIMTEHYGRDVPLKPGVWEYLQALKANGCRLCVATATAEPLARLCLERLQVADLFEDILSCETAGIGKDQPHIYHQAAQLLGSTPQETAVFEDVLPAAQTAKAAGFHTVGIYDTYAARRWPELQALCDETIPDWTLAIAQIGR